MGLSITDRIKNAWNAFRTEETADYTNFDLGPGYSARSDRVRLRWGVERSILSSIYTRIGIDAAAIPIQHVRLDQNGRYLETIPSYLNRCLGLKANIDQTGRAFVQDIVMSMCDEGAVAIVPVDTTSNPIISGSYDILSLRVGKIVQWYPQHVRVNLYNERTGNKEDLVFSKATVAIVENPLYAVMNESNSTLKRLQRKLILLDANDEESGSGKLDLIVQLPYTTSTPLRKKQAEVRKADVENQLLNSRYGIVYVDGTEKITQLNRPAENHLMEQIEYLTAMLYGQLGLGKAIFDGTASEAVMLDYYNRTIEPILGAITDSMKATFLTTTAMSQGQSLVYIRDPFRLVPSSQIATIVEPLSRNAILSPNELRGLMGFKPSGDQDADSLRNRNLNPQQDQGVIEINQNGSNLDGQTNSNGL